MEDSYNQISKNIISYIPSKLLVVINALFIVPLLSHLFDEKEMSFFFIGIYLVNITCTCTSDWITKAVIRFYEKYKIQEQLDDFLSSIMGLLILANITISIIFIFSFNFINENFGLSFTLLLQILFILLPCGIRQLLFQILRVQNKSFLYTGAIFLYQLTFILLIISFYKYNTNATFIIMAMNISILLIDIILIKQLKFKLKFKLDKAIINEITKYGAPLIITNICYWLSMQFSKLYFQEQSLFLFTAILGFCMLLVNNIIQSVASAFIFAGFPVIIEKYEHKQKIQQYWTKTLQLYFWYILPIVLTFCFLSSEITNVFLPEKYAVCATILPFFALAGFSHELLKLITVKYHINNVTYTESFITLLIVICAIFLNILLINAYELLGAAIALFLSELLFLIINSLVKIGPNESFEIKQTSKTLILMLIAGVLVFIFTQYFMHLAGSFIHNIKLVHGIKIFLFISLYYFICNIFKKRILSYD